MKNPYKNHKHDGGDDVGLVDCLLCEKEMLWNLRQPIKSKIIKAIKKG